MALNFQKVNATDVQATRATRGSKFNDLITACKDMNPGDIFAVSPDSPDQDLKKLRLGISMAIRRSVTEVWENANIMKLIRVSAGRDNDNQDVIIIECKETDRETLDKKLIERKKRSDAMKKRQKAAGGSLKKKAAAAAK